MLKKIKDEWSFFGNFLNFQMQELRFLKMFLPQDIRVGLMLALEKQG